MQRAILAGGSLWLGVLLALVVPAPLRSVGQPLPVQPAALQPQAPQAPDYQLLSNPSLESYDPPYGQYQGVDCQVASGWQRFWYGGPEPYWMDTRVFAGSDLGCGWVERIADDTSQMILSTEPYTAGLWQQVSGLTQGAGYGFHAALLTIFQTSAQPPVHGTMIKEVGLDPTGGTDPLSPQVVWSEQGGQDHGWDVTRSTAAYAQGPTMTVFIRVTSPHPSGGLPLWNQSFLDSAILALTAHVSAMSPPASDEAHFEVRWDNAVPSPGGEIRWYDVQWQDEAEGVWHEWLAGTASVAATFSGQWGHTYRFRARAWQRYPNGAHLPSPYSAGGDTRTCVGLELTGRVLDPQERGVRGANVTVLETGQTAVSGPDGSFALVLPSSPTPVSLAVSHANWLAPPPIYGLGLTPAPSRALTWTLRPRDDALFNGDFEAGLEGWSAALGAAEAVPEPVHSGYSAARLAWGGSETLSLVQPLSAAGLSQSVGLANAWAPALSFWYLAGAAAEGDVLEVALTVAAPAAPAAGLASGRLRFSLVEPLTKVLTVPLPADGRWHHFWSYVDRPREALTGTVTAEVRLPDQTGGEPVVVYLDDVSLGSTPGGPWGFYLPLVSR